MPVPDKDHHPGDELDKREESGTARRVTMRFTPDVLEMIENGLLWVDEEAGRNKTSFVKRAIRHYYETLKEKKSVNGLRPVDDNKWLVKKYDQLLASVLSENENQTVSDFVDYVQHSWTLHDNSTSKSFPIYARILRLAQYIDILETKLRAEPLNLTSNELRILSSLRRNKQKGLTPSDLKQELLVSSGAVTRQIDRLVKLGLVERYQDTDDRRSVKISLTPKGREMIDHMISVSANDFLSMLIHYLSKEEQKVLEIILRKLIIIMEDYMEKLNRR